MTTFLLGCGLLLLALGGVGLIRFRDPYQRLHGAGVGDIGGASLILIGLLAQGWDASAGVKLVLLAFLVVTGPIATHAVAKAAFVRRHRPGGDQ